MMPIRHVCGYELERGNEVPGAFFDLVGPDDQAHSIEVAHCPECSELLCDTDCMDLAGVPLPVYNQSEWSKERRRQHGWAE